MSDNEPIIYLTQSEYTNQYENRLSKWRGEKPKKLIKGFRYGVAKSKPYKGNRQNPTPFHLPNIVAILMSDYNTVVSRDGLEADDMMCIEQYNSEVGDTIICSRDKDLRICPGHHYSWECGNQRSVGPVVTDKVGHLEKAGANVLGYGLSFFYYQMLVGDSADNIPGLPGVGKVRAFNCLHSLDNEYDLFKVVKDYYKEVMREEAKEYFTEQANLLWMRMDDGKPYKFPEKVTKQ
jgi:DNA polymerase-1